jgi:hypothetical protein
MPVETLGSISQAEPSSRALPCQSESRSFERFPHPEADEVIHRGSPTPERAKAFEPQNGLQTPATVPPYLEMAYPGTNLDHTWTPGMVCNALSSKKLQVQKTYLKTYPYKYRYGSP